MVLTFSTRFILPLIVVLAVAPLSAQQKSFYRLESTVSLAGVSPSWDYLALDTARARLFIGRRSAGVTVYDLATHRVIRTIANSEGANATAIASDLDRGYTTNEDGSVTAFRLSTLETIARIKVAEDADASVYDSVTRQLVVMMGDSKAIAFLDAQRGTMTGRLAMKSAQLDGAVVDGSGNLFVAERDRNAIARVDVAKRRETAEWKVKGCDEPTGLALDRAHNRLLIGCRGARPVLAVMDSRSGIVVGTYPIGRGNDGVVYDVARHRVLTSNGVDANLVVYTQDAPDRYSLAEATTTRPYARTMAFDAVTETVYLVTAEGTVDPDRKVNRGVAPFYPNTYFDNTFTLLIYSRR